MTKPSRLSCVTVWTDSGDTWKTSFNGTEQEAVGYFMGQVFNIGPRWINSVEREDHLVRVNAVHWEPSSLASHP